MFKYRPLYLLLAGLLTLSPCRALSFECLAPVSNASQVSPRGADSILSAEEKASLETLALRILRENNRGLSRLIQPNFPTFDSAFYEPVQMEGSETQSSILEHITERFRINKANGISTLAGFTGGWASGKSFAMKLLAFLISTSKEVQELRDLGAQFVMILGDDYRGDKISLDKLKTYAPDLHLEFKEIQNRFAELRSLERKSKKTKTEKGKSKKIRSSLEGRHAEWVFKMRALGLRTYNMKGEIEELEHNFDHEWFAGFLLAMKGQYRIEDMASDDPKRRFFFRPISDGKTRGQHRIELASDGRIIYRLGLGFDKAWIELAQENGELKLKHMKMNEAGSPVESSAEELESLSEFSERGIQIRLVGEEGRKRYRIYFGEGVSFEEKSHVDVEPAMDGKSLEIHYENDDLPPIKMEIREGEPAPTPVPLLIRHHFNADKLYFVDSLLLPNLKELDLRLSYRGPVALYDELVYFAANLHVRYLRALYRQLYHSGSEYTIPKLLATLMDRAFVLEDPWTRQGQGESRLVVITHSRVEALSRLWAGYQMETEEIKNELQHSFGWSHKKTEGMLRNMKQKVIRTIASEIVLKENNRLETVTEPNGVITVSLGSNLVLQFQKLRNPDGSFCRNPEDGSFRYGIDGLQLEHLRGAVLNKAGDAVVRSTLVNFSAEQIFPEVRLHIQNSAGQTVEEEGTLETVLVQERGYTIPKKGLKGRNMKDFLQELASRIDEAAHSLDPLEKRNLKALKFRTMAENLLRDALRNEIDLLKAGLVNTKPRSILKDKVVTWIPGGIETCRHASLSGLETDPKTLEVMTLENYLAAADDLPPMFQKWFKREVAQFFKKWSSEKFENLLTKTEHKKKRVLPAMDIVIARDIDKGLTETVSFLKINQTWDQFVERDGMGAGAPLAKQILGWVFLLRSVMYLDSQVHDALDELHNKMEEFLLNSEKPVSSGELKAFFQSTWNQLNLKYSVLNEANTADYFIGRFFYEKTYDFLRTPVLLRSATSAPVSSPISAIPPAPVAESA